jgi:hypothetical protein
MAAITRTQKGRSRERLADLHRLIEALDSRVPRLERKGETAIAREAADLRARALSRIREIEAAGDGPSGSGGPRPRATTLPT